MIHNLQKNTLSPSTESVHAPSKEDFIDLIQTAQKVDHQMYTEQAITPIGFGVKARTPSLKNLLNLPQQIKEKLVTLLQNPAPTTSKVFYAAVIEVTAQCLNLCYSLLQPFLYLGVFTALIAKRLSIGITLQVIALAYATIEIARNLWHLRKDQKFASICSLEPVKYHEALDSATNKEDTLLAMSHLLKSLQNQKTFLSPETYQQSLQTLRSLKRETEIGTKRFFEAQDIFLPLWKQIEKEFLIAKITAVKNKFLLFSSKEKEQQLQIATKLYDKLPYAEALHKSLDIIQHRFREKKNLFAERARPWLAFHFISSYEKILHNLENPNASTTEIKEAKALLNRLHVNSQLAQQVKISNIVVFAIVVISTLLSLIAFAHPLLNLAIIGTSTAFQLYNTINIHGVMDNKQGNFVNWLACIPTWLHRLGQKLHSYFTPKTDSAPIKPFRAQPISRSMMKHSCL